MTYTPPTTLPIPDLCKEKKLWHGEVLPISESIPQLKDVTFYVIKKWEKDIDGYDFLHGVALAFHKGKLFATFGHNQGIENSAGECVNGLISYDNGFTWGEKFTVDAGQGNLGVSHGVLLSYSDRLWSFNGAFYDDFKRTHMRAYFLDESANHWQSLGVVIDDGFWPMQQPLKMSDGNWIMSGIRVAKGYAFKNNDPAIAISHGDDLTQWDMITIKPEQGVENIWGESTVYIQGTHVINISRWGGQAKALVAQSINCGRSWTPSAPSNLHMTTSKPCTGTLSTGQHYLICTTTADSDQSRHPLTIAVTRPGEMIFSMVFAIRRAYFPEGPGESDLNAALSYPYAVEHEGHLYVGYSNNGGRKGMNINSAELAVIPITSLQITN